MMATISAGTFHVIHTELVVGILSLAAISLVLLCVLRLSPKVPFITLEQKERLVKAFDNTQMVSSSFGLIFIPIAMVSGIIASEGEATTNPILLNKIILSSISIGAWLAFVVARFRHGDSVWETKGMAIVHTINGLFAYFITTLVATLGGKYTRNESLYDLLPFSLGIYEAIIAPSWLNILLIFIGVISIIMLFLLPKLVEVDNTLESVEHIDSIPPISLSASKFSDGFEWVTWPEGSSEFYYRLEGSNDHWKKH
tara:strand:+ start:627 stop:1391 length:765 start_codon:yes stop_codon:yes gene_type:complete